MNLDDVKSRTTQKEGEISLIEKQLEEVKLKKEEVKRAYTKGLLDNASRERKLPSLDVQQKNLANINAEIEGLEDAKALLQSELEALKTEARYCGLYETQGKRYLRAMGNCEEAHSQIMSLLESLKQDLAAFNISVSKLVKEQGTARAAFCILRDDIHSSLSLRAFLDGEIAEIEASDKEAVGQEVHARIMSASDINHESINREFEHFRRSMEMLNQWRRFYVSRQGQLPQYDFVYKPKGVRSIAPDAETARATRLANEVREKEELKKAELKKKRQRLAVG